MNKKRVLAMAPMGVLIPAVALLVACAGVQQPANHPELAAAQACIENQALQTKRVEEQHGEILSGLTQLQAQLNEQQQTLAARPQIVEKIIKEHCPKAPVVKAPSIKSPPPLTDKQIVGLREQVLINGLEIVMPARISTGVTNSVLDARNIQMFERNSEEWVRFTVYSPDSKEPHVLERKRLRFQTVQSVNDTADRRPVVEMRFTIGKLAQKGEFVLADRSSSEFPVLIGRNLLRDVMLVDVSRNNLAPLPRKNGPSGSSNPANKK